MDYGQIIRRSWQLVREHRYLWGLGILALFVEGGFGFPNFFGSIPTPRDFSDSTYPEPAGSFSWNQGWMATRDWIDANILWVTLGAIATILIGLLISYICHACQAALIKEVTSLEESKKPAGHFGKAYTLGRPFAWRLFGMRLLVTFGSLLALAIVAAPLVVGYMRAENNTSDGPMALLILATLLIILAAIFCFIVLGIVLRLAERVLVLENRRIVVSLQEGYRIFQAQPGSVLLTWLVNVGIGFVWVFALILLMMGLALGLVMLGIPLFLVGTPVVGIPYAVLAGTLFILVLVVTYGAFGAFLSSYWTISYRALSYLARHGS